MNSTFRAILITGLILCILISGAYLSLPVGQYLISKFFPNQEKESAENSESNIFPINEEDASSAARPLSEVLEELDFSKKKENHSFYIFDIIVQSRLRRESFTELDGYFDQLRSGKDRFPGGAWKEFRLCESLAVCKSSKEYSERAWSEHFGRLERWRKQYPNSGLAVVVTAQALIDWAWEARGSGYADSVTPGAWYLFRKRLLKCRYILDYSQAPRTSMWYYSRLIVAKGIDHNRDEYEKIFDDAVKLEPLFIGFYTEKACNLLPRWHGKQGEWQKFAAESADRIGGDEGDALYYFITSHIWDYYWSQKFFTVENVSWSRMVRGFEVARKLYGTSQNRLDEFCGIADQIKETPKTCGFFNRIWR